MGWKKLTLALLGTALISLWALAPTAGAARVFHPHVGHGMGLVPAHGEQIDPALATAIPEVYHGGQVMHDVTIHTIWWAPAGFRFDPAPALLTQSYKQLIEQYLSDVAADPRGPTNVFSVLDQYPDGAGRYGTHISYDPATDSIDDGTPYPAPGHRCVSPGGVPACVTDVELQQEIDRNIQAHDPAGRTLHDLWFIFLPPNVDTCLTLGSCATNAYAGYHSLLNLGHGPAIYVAVPDPLIEFTPPPGSDPEGNPEAETTVDTVAHETVEAITNPEGEAWMDPNGFEVGDKCESGPQYGTPLGYALNGSPYNQVVNGHQYLIQTMWSNADTGCQQSSSSTNSALPLPMVSLRQFSPVVSGSMGFARAGMSVEVLLGRAGNVVAGAIGRTRPDGSWRMSLQSLATGGPVGAGDDRDEVLVRYGSGGPAPELIETGNGGDPFDQAGWTSWFDLDHGFAVGSRSVLLAPCSQVGVLALGGTGPTPSPVEQCVLADGAAQIPTGRLTPRTALSLSSEDNRAASLAAPNGALVKLTVPLGEPNSIDPLGNPLVPFFTSGQPACSADLRTQKVTCSGLVPGSRYVLTRQRGHARRAARARGSGVAGFSRFSGRAPVRGGDKLVLRNRAGRLLTTLHVAHLRVHIKGASTVVASGSCQQGEYYGSEITTPPVSPGIGIPGVANSGTVCPQSGRAKGLRVRHIFQVDDRSGGITRTEVATIEGTAPVQDATLYGSFVLLAQAGLPGPHGTTIPARDRVGVTITPAGSRRKVFSAANVNTGAGVGVSALPPGSYVAEWVLRDANGDTRTVRTHFTEI